MKQQGWITVGISVLLIVSVVVASHVRLEGKIDTLTETNVIFHTALKEGLDEVRKDVKSHLQKDIAMIDNK